MNKSLSEMFWSWTLDDLVAWQAKQPLRRRVMAALRGEPLIPTVADTSESLRDQHLKQLKRDHPYVDVWVDEDLRVLR